MANRFTLLLLAGVLLAGCKKEESDDSSNNNGGGSGNGTASTTPSFTGANGVLVATRSYSVVSTPLGPQDILIGLAFGAFSDDQFATRVNAGPVSCNGQSVPLQAGNAYVYTPPPSNPTGIDLTATNEVTWTVGGGSGFTGFTRTIMGAYPITGEITSGATVSRAAGHTLSASSVANADSVLFAIGTVTRTIPGNASVCTFSSAELSGLLPGAALAQVVSYSSVSESIGGKQIHFVKQSLRNQSVTVQ